jgi:hypothetical protein
LYLLTTISLSIVLLEYTTRLLRLAPPLPQIQGVADAYLPYKPPPLSTTAAQTAEYHCEYQHNSLGLRDVEHPLAKPEGVFRILGLGDSFTYGIGVPVQQTYLSQLEQLLNQRGGQHPKVEIINAGIYRYFPEPERLWLEHYGLAYAPDLILVGFVPNDVLDTHLGIEAVTVEHFYLVTREAQALGPLGHWLYLHSHVARIVLGSYVSHRIQINYHPRRKEVYKANGYHENDWQRIEQEYAKMKRLADSINARLAIVHIPQQGPWKKQHSYPARRLAEWSARNGIQFIDTLPAMKEYPAQEALYYKKDGHCRPAGHTVIARTLFTELIGKGLVP